MIQRLAAGCLLLTGSVLMAQDSSEIQDVEPRWVAVSVPAASLHCGDLARFYAVADLGAGTVLRLNGESNEWARVIYPNSVYPFVPASEAKDLGNDHIELTKASQLRAPSKLMGLAGSWRSVYRTALPVGTLFEIVGRETNADGDVTAYAVKPINGQTIGTLPHGFIRTDEFRAATEAEVQAHLASAGQPQITPVETPASDPAIDEANGHPSVPSEDNVDKSLLSPINSTLPAVDAQADPAAELPEDAAENVTTTVIEQASVGTVEDEPYADEYGIRPARLIELEDAFEATRVLPREELDGALEELLAEYTRALEATTEESVQRALQSRMGWIKIRMDSRDKRLELAAFLSESNDTRQRNTELVEQWRAGQSFDYVGRVLVSRVYDGKRLPKMYRLVGNNPLTGPRTLGYLPEGGEFDPGQFVGQVIGVRGSIDLNPESRLRLVKVETVSVMPGQ